MIHRRHNSFVAPVALAALSALTAVACSSGTDDHGVSTRPAAPTSGPGPTIDVADSHLGKILVDSQSRTLYVFKADSGTTSACFGACASAWPPLRTASPPTVGGGAKVSLAATTARSDGEPEVTYNGHPLYRFAGDQRAGDTNGQGLTAFGGEWLVLSPAGDAVVGH